MRLEGQESKIIDRTMNYLPSPFKQNAMIKCNMSAIIPKALESRASHPGLLSRVGESNLHFNQGPQVLTLRTKVSNSLLRWDIFIPLGE